MGCFARCIDDHCARSCTVFLKNRSACRPRMTSPAFHVPVPTR
jgi:hypothetical protein